MLSLFFFFFFFFFFFLPSSAIRPSAVSVIGSHASASARAAGDHANMCSVTSQGRPYAIFLRALERGSLIGVRSAVANLPGPPPLEDALVICRLILEQEPERYERAAVRWLGRLLLEQRGVSLRRAELAAAYLAAWADPARRDAAAEALGGLGRAVGLRRLDARLGAARDNG
jgi:hypothetical protein